jgi:DNA-binding HxlR family transcriptional regulator
MKPTHLHLSEDCRAVSAVLQRVGDKWTILVVQRLGGGPRRFNELRTEVGGISQKMLTTTLRGLERDGFVTRTVFPTIPPRVDYELTDLGRELLVPVHALGGMGALEYRPHLCRAREIRRIGRGVTVTATHCSLSAKPSCEP